MKTETSRKLLILIIAAVTIDQLFGGTSSKIYENFMRRETMILADSPVFTKYAAQLYAISKKYISSSIKIDRPVLQYIAAVQKGPASNQRYKIHVIFPRAQSSVLVRLVNFYYTADLLRVVCVVS
jgi:hypothetical protein